MPPKKRDGAVAAGQGALPSRVGVSAATQSSRARTREREAAVAADDRSRAADGLQALSPAALYSARQAMARYGVCACVCFYGHVVAMCVLTRDSAHYFEERQRYEFARIYVSTRVY